MSVQEQEERAKFNKELEKTIEKVEKISLEFERRHLSLFNDMYKMQRVLPA